MPRLKSRSNREERPIYQPWYEGDFWTLRVRGLHPIARLMYRSIIQQGWDLPIPGRIPSDESMLMVLADCPDIETWQKYGPSVLKMFDLSEDGTYYTNERQQYELAKWRKLRKDYADRGRMGGKAKQANKLNGKQKASSATTEAALAKNDGSNQVRLGQVRLGQVKEDLNTNARKARGQFEFPDWVPRNEFDAYVEMRKKIKKPMTENAIHLAVKKLGNLRERGHPPIEVLNQSIEHSWNGLFELKEDGNAKSQGNHGAPGKGSGPKSQSGTTKGAFHGAGSARFDREPDIVA